MEEKKINFIDLFCGCGGFSYGLEKAGLNCMAGIDFLKDAIETFGLNHPNAISICEDLRKLDPKNVKSLIKNKKVHLICGGPPCQGFSTIGTGDANDSRNHLFLEFFKFVDYFRPNYILVENVTGLLAEKNRNTLLSIFECFEKIGYHVDVKVLSSDHYGVPEVRRRVIIVGNNKNIKNEYPEQIHGDDVNLKDPNTVGWAFKNLVRSNGKSFNHTIQQASIKKDIDLKRIRCVPEGKYIRYEKDEKEYLPRNLWFDHDWNKISENRFREAKYYRLSRDKPSPTIVTHRGMYYHPTKDRYLTVREAAALQSFPPDFRFKGSLTKQWVQIGNAVPPMMSEQIGKSILLMHKNIRKKIRDRKPRDIDEIRSTAFLYKKSSSKDDAQIKMDL